MENGKQKPITVSMAELIIGGPGFNVRSLDPKTVEKYQEVADQLPPVEIWTDPETEEMFLVDGRHRCEARKLAGFDDITATILACERVDAEVRAFSANLAHPLPLSEVQRRRAIEEIVTRRYTRANNWIAEEAKCSPKTIGRARERLEAEGKIPVLDQLERKDGVMTPRTYNKIDSAGKEDSLFGNEPDFFDEAEEREAAKRQQEAERGVRPPADLMGGERVPTRDGGYNVDEDEDPEAEEEASGPLITGLEHSMPVHLPRDYNTGDGSNRPRQHSLNFARVGEAVPAEVTMYIDGQAHSIRVTVIFADGAIAGLPDTSLPENQQAALILEARLGQALRLVY